MTSFDNVRPVMTREQLTRLMEHAISMTSCTTALHAVLACMEIKGQEVIVPDYTYPATAEAVIRELTS